STHTPAASRATSGPRSPSASSGAPCRTQARGCQRIQWPTRGAACAISRTRPMSSRSTRPRSSSLGPAAGARWPRWRHWPALGCSSRAWCCSTPCWTCASRRRGGSGRRWCGWATGCCGCGIAPVIWTLSPRCGASGGCPIGAGGSDG
ncbi:unnamed protein product, partial [Prorocentrum cordatum]